MSDPKSEPSPAAKEWARENFSVGPQDAHRAAARAYDAGAAAKEQEMAAERRALRAELSYIIGQVSAFDLLDPDADNSNAQIVAAKETAALIQTRLAAARAALSKGEGK